MKKITALVLLLLVITGFAQTHSIKLNLKKGETYSTLMDIKMDMLQKAMGQEMPMKINFLIGYSFKVTEAEKGGYTLEGKYNYIGNDMQMMGQDMKMASDLKDENPVNKMFAAMINVPFTLKVKDNGEVLSVEGYDKIMEGMTNALPENMREQMSEEFGKSFSKDQVAQNLKSTFFAIPPKPVKIGETWEAVFTANNNGVEMVHNMNCKLEAADQQSYKISYTGNFAAKEGSTMVQSGMKMDVKKMEGTTSGMLLLDKKTAWVKNNDSKGKLNMMMDMKMGDQPMEVESVTDITITATDAAMPALAK